MKTGAFIVPTGIGASIGGFAGDASLWARKFSEISRLIVNPNVVNAACFSGITDNMLYVEGYSLDEFFRGKLNLLPVLTRTNKVGVVFDKSISQHVLNVHINTINAVKTVYGIDVIGYELTEQEVGVNFYINKSGISMGDVSNLSTIKRAAEKLIIKGADAIAVVCLFSEDESENYAQGKGVDPVGGVEAIISHYISKELKVPCAHAPAFENIEISTDIVDPRAAAEYITPTFLPCILIGLSSAPKLSFTDKGLFVDDVDFLIVPYTAVGSIPVLEMTKRGKQVYAVKENATELDVTPDKINKTCVIIKTYRDLWELVKNE